MVIVSYIVLVVILIVVVIIRNSEYGLYCDDGGHTHDVGDHTQW